jgi:hypothetical protein
MGAGDIIFFSLAGPVGNYTGNIINQSLSGPVERHMPLATRVQALREAFCFWKFRRVFSVYFFGRISEAAMGVPRYSFKVRRSSVGCSIVQKGRILSRLQGAVSPQLVGPGSQGGQFGVPVLSQDDPDLRW